MSILINTKDTRSIYISVMMLVGIGTVMIYSSTALMSMIKYGSGFHYLWNHLFTVFAGVGAMLVIAKLDYRKVRPLIYVLLGLSVIMLVLVFVPGIGLSANGAQRWLRLAYDISAFGAGQDCDGDFSCGLHGQEH